jgi:hypothetical protein
MHHFAQFCNMIVENFPEAPNPTTNSLGAKKRPVDSRRFRKNAKTIEACCGGGCRFRVPISGDAERPLAGCTAGCPRAPRRATTLIYLL